MYVRTNQHRNKPYVSHAQFFALIHKECAAQGSLHERKQFGTVIAVSAAVIAISRDGSWIIVVFNKDTVPTIAHDHGSLPFGDCFCEIFDAPIMKGHSDFSWLSIQLYDIKDEDHVKFAAFASHGADYFIDITDARHFADGDGAILL